RLLGGAVIEMKNLPADDPLVKQCKEQTKKEAPSVEDCGGGKMQVTFPPELILAMGISLASFAGSSLIQSSKQQKTVNVEARTKSVLAATEAKTQAQKDRDDLDKQLTATRNDKTAGEAAVKNAKDALLQAQDIVKQAQPNPTKAQLDQVIKAQEDLDFNMSLLVDAENNLTKIGKALKDAADALKTAEARLTQAQEEEKAAATAAGVLQRNKEPAQASWLDLFRGDEVGNYVVVDMAKVQMFFFTLVVVFAYGVSIAALLRDSAVLSHPLGVDLPAFSNSLNTLLGISHGAYLSVKAFDHTEVAK
ncbi:MAG: hypothetical protein HZC40_05950, partial [Chloroflexi bacterium]|nr:hypothetical protein [Chloroflexota bacterium]